MADSNCPRCNHGYHRGPCMEVLSKTRDIRCSCVEFRGSLSMPLKGALVDVDRPGRVTLMESRRVGG